MMRTTLQKAILQVALFAVLLTWSMDGKAAELRFYDSPEAAGQALAAAVKANDIKEILAVLGPKAAPLVESGDPQAAAAERAAFIKAYEEKHTLVAVPGDSRAGEQGTAPIKGKEAGKAKADELERRILEIGPDGWPFPIPLVRETTAKGGSWFFDSSAGVQELLNRRIGNNELSAIQVCLAYVDAQNEYYRRNPEQKPMAHFAQKIMSSPGMRDGLYWPAKEGEEPSPLGALVAAAEAGREASAKMTGGGAYHGYRYRILTGQGPHADQGAYSYIGNGLMFGGFALLAYPETYGATGVMSFLINQEGVLFEKNLGKDTAALAARITLFDPDSSWTRVTTD